MLAPYSGHLPLLLWQNSQMRKTISASVPRYRLFRPKKASLFRVLAKFQSCCYALHELLSLLAKEIRTCSSRAALSPHRQLGQTLIPALAAWCLIDVVAFVFCVRDAGR